VKYEEQPKLFSIIFGEGIVNDAVALILFQTVATIKASTDPAPTPHLVESSTYHGSLGNDPSPSASSIPLPIKILMDFALLGILSLGIGISVGLIISYIFKRMRFLTHSAIKETLLVFCSGYLAYAIGELAGQSGIICLLTTGVIIAHYGWYNLSPQGKVLSSATI
jgi:NhaP-type Na+/H+ or K+/H+ antiporter